MDKHYVYIYLDPFKPGRWEYETIVFDYKPFYVGIGIGRRCRVHLTKSGLKYGNNKIKGRWINSILNKGVEPIIIKMYENLTLDEAKRTEVDIIKHFGRIIDKSGILTNITPGGDTTCANSIGKDNMHSKIVYQYDLNGNFIKKWDSLSDASRKLKIKHVGISKCALGENKKGYNYMWFYEHKGEKIEPYKEYENKHNCKTVYQYDLNGNFIKKWDCGAAEIERIVFKNNFSRINACCSGKLKSAYKQMWFYEYRGNKIEKYKKYDVNKVKSNYKKVYVFDLSGKLINNFDGACLAAIHFNIPKTNISKCARKNCKYKDVYLSYDKNFKVPKQKFWLYNNKQYNKLIDISKEYNLKPEHARYLKKCGKVMEIFV